MASITTYKVGKEVYRLMPIYNSDYGISSRDADCNGVIMSIDKNQDKYLKWRCKTYNRSI